MLGLKKIFFLIMGMQVFLMFSPLQADSVSTLERARKSYQNQKYDESLSLFSQCLEECLEESSSKKKEGKFQEAQLGGIVSQLLLSKKVDSRINELSPTIRYYWNGNSFSLWDDISTKSQEELQKNLSSDKSYIFLQVVDLLIRERHLAALSFFIKEEKLDESLEQVVWDFSLTKAWGMLQKNKILPAKELFLFLKKNLPSVSRFTQSGQSGWLLTQVLSQPWKEIHIDEVTKAFHHNSFFLDREEWSLQESTSLAALFERGGLAEAKDLNKYRIFLAEMIYSFGKVSTQHDDVWRKGLIFLNKKASAKEPFVLFMKRRFHCVLGWDVLAKGDLKKAEKIFRRLLKASQSVQEEAHLALLVLEWKKYSSLSQCIEKAKEKKFQNQFWMAGRNLEIFRFPHRQENREQWQKVFQENSIHRVFLILLDSLCLLGDGRSAYELLGNLVDTYPELQELYILEEENIPKDPYTDGKIWEKLY